MSLLRDAAPLGEGGHATPRRAASVPPLIPGPAPDTAAAPSGLGDLGLAAALLALTLASIAGFDRIFSDHGWMVPVVATALGSHLLSALLRRTRTPPVVAMAICLAGVVLLGVGCALGLSAFGGSPDALWQIVVDDVDQARAQFPAVVAPVPSAPGFDLLAAWGAGLIATLGDWGTFRLRSALQGAAPGFGLFVLCCVLGAPPRRTFTVTLWLAAAVLFLLIHRSATGHQGDAWFAGRRGRAQGRTIAAGLAIGIAALLVGVAVTPALAPRDGRGVLGWRDGPGQGGTRLVESPIVDLRTRIVQERNIPVFTVRSPVPNYWRLTSLDTFTGTLWESTDSYESVHQQLPGVTPAPPGTREVVESFRIQNLDSIWLPVAFNPESVVGGGTVTYDPTSGSLLTNRPTSNNLAYQVSSRQQLGALDATKLKAAGPAPYDALTRRYLQLPSGIPAAVVSLARRITAGDKTEYAKALALQNYLLGPSFTYSTDPPTDGYSTSALATFLLDTKTGYCQQFAGSYAVMARIVGIPTRLAVGFATGTADGKGVYHVTDADAHTWPEVLFPRYGWVPFEPTKGNFAIPGGDAYTGSKLGDGPQPNGGPSSPGRSRPPSTKAQGGGPTPSPQTGTTPGGPGHPGRAHALTGPLLAGVAGAIAVLAAWPAINALTRRRRWARRRRQSGPSGSALVVVAWQEIGERLAWRGVPRSLDETPGEYARRASLALSGIVDGSAGGARTVGPALVALADTVNQARFADQDVPRDAAGAAMATADDVRRTLSLGAPLTLRLRWWVDPRWAWSRSGTTGG